MSLIFRRAFVGAAVAILVASAASWFVAASVETVVVAQREASEIAQFLVSIEGVLSAAVEAESHVRGFAITGAEARVTAFEGAVDRFWRDLEDTQRWPGAEPYAGELRAIGETFDRWEANQAKTVIATRRRHPPQELREGLAASVSWIGAVSLRSTWMRRPGSAAPPIDAWTSAIEAVERAVSAVLAQPLQPERRVAWSNLAVSLTHYREAIVGPGSSPNAFSDPEAGLEVGDVGARLVQLTADVDRAEAELAALLVSGEGADSMSVISSIVDAMGRDAAARLQALSGSATARQRATIATAWAAPLLVALVSSLVVLLFLTDVTRHVVRLRHATRAMAAGESVEPIGERGPVAMRSFTRDFDRMIGNIEGRDVESQALLGLATMLQAARSEDEVLRIASGTMSQLFPDDVGSVWLVNSSRDVMHTAADWGQAQPEAVEPLGLDSCWALRQGRMVVKRGPQDVRCAHDPTRDGSTTCVPLVSRDDTLGILSIHRDSEAGLSSHEQLLMRVAAEHVALALANIRLREALERQSVRDPLTGLFNRRFLDDALAIEIRRSGRTKQPVAVILLDIDHFKQFNDTHGHDAGDAALRAVAGALTASIRSGDLACRFGGEEFLLLLPATDVEAAGRRAEGLRLAVSAAKATIRGEDLPSVTASFGVAAMGGAEFDGRQLVHAADSALYAAKRAGRDRVVTADS